MKIKICPKCKKEFTPIKHNCQKYCTVECRTLTYKAKNNKPLYCQICDKKLIRPQRTYCSKKCLHKGSYRRTKKYQECLAKKEEFCKACGKYIKDIPLKRSFCSNLCSISYNHRRPRLVFL